MNGLGARWLSWVHYCGRSAEVAVLPLTKLVKVVPFFFSDLLEPPTTPARLPPIWGRGNSGLPVGPDGPKSGIETEIPLDQFFFPCPLALNWCTQTWTNKWCLAVLPVQWTTKMQRNTIATDSKDIPHTAL